MLKDYMAILNLNENDENLRSLTHSRPLASIPIGGRYRIIDFVLSNIVNAGISNVGVFTQSRSRSLMDHLGSGKPWDLDRKLNGLFIFNYGIANSYVDDIDLFRNNIEYFYESKQKYVIVSSSYFICNMNIEEVAKFHDEKNADITIVYKKIQDGKKNFIDCDCLNLNDNNKVISVGRNMGVENFNNISMELFIMKKELLVKIINECIQKGYCRNLKDAIYKNTLNYNVYGFEFKGYTRCVNSIKSYYKANMDLLDIKVNKELFYSNGLIYTKVKDEAPTKYFNGCKVSNSLIANGSVIEGNIESSIISRRVIVQKGAEVKNCIIMQNCTISEGAKLSNIIIDKNVIIEPHKELKGDKKFPLVIEKRALFYDY